MKFFKRLQKQTVEKLKKAKKKFCILLVNVYCNILVSAAYDAPVDMKQDNVSRAKEHNFACGFTRGDRRSDRIPGLRFMLLPMGSVKDQIHEPSMSGHGQTL
jgi:hypothetical protein